jgi:hypothetical protein
MTSRCAVALYGLEALEQRRLLSAGDLDASFGVDGRFAQPPTAPSTSSSATMAATPLMPTRTTC